MEQENPRPTGGEPSSGSEASPARPKLVSTRFGGALRQMDVATLITLIQQNVLAPDCEVQSEDLTAGEWRRLDQLELYQTLSSTRPCAAAAAESRSSRLRRKSASSRKMYMNTT
jgi:hypothetical protein